jgi:hypothetical protein
LVVGGSARLWSLADRVFTFSYFVPTMIKLQGDTNLSASEAVAMASRWGQLNHLRHLIVLVAWVAALKAFSLLKAQRMTE